MALFLQEFFFHKKRFHQIITRGILEGHDFFSKLNPFSTRILKRFESKLSTIRENIKMNN